MTDGKKPAFEDRSISAVYITEYRPYYLPDRAGVGGDVTVFLTTRDGGKDGPKLQLSFAIDCDPTTTFEQIHLQLFREVADLAGRLAREAPESLYQHMKRSAAESYEKFSDQED